MAIGKISGTMLQANLERQGTNISIDATAYFDVNNYRVGVNNASPQYTLDVNGNAHMGNVYILGNAITTDSGKKLNLGAITNLTVTGGSPNYIVYTDGAGNLNFANLSALTGLEGFSGNSISLGSNTLGALVSNAGSFTGTTAVTDAVAILNQILGNITNSSGSVIHVAGNITAGNITIVNSVNTNTVYANTYAYANGASILTGVTYNYSNANITAYLAAGTDTTISNITSNVSTAQTTIATHTTWLGNLQANVYSNANVANYLVTNTGNISAGNIVVTGIHYGNIATDIISPYQTSLTVFNSNTAIQLPIGNTGTRPANHAGYIRYNSDLSVIEFNNGTAWVPLTNTINDQIITPDGVNVNYTLSQSATANGILVSINGTVQRPGVAYTVSGTTITFSETPLVTDIIDIRYIATAAVTSSLDFTIVDTGNITVGTANTIVDSFSATQYRSAKYTISSTNPYDSQFAEIMLVQNAGVTAISTIGNVRTGANSVTYTANITSGTVNLLANSSTAATQLRIQRTYFNV